MYSLHLLRKTYIVNDIQDLLFLIVHKNNEFTMHVSSLIQKNIDAQQKLLVESYIMYITLQ